jgi:hypothetical protein
MKWTCDISPATCRTLSTRGRSDEAPGADRVRKVTASGLPHMQDGSGGRRRGLAYGPAGFRRRVFLLLLSGAASC